MLLKAKLTEFLEKQGLNTPDLSRRMKVLDAGKRSISIGNFETVTQATFIRKRLRLDHFNRTTGEHKPASPVKSMKSALAADMSNYS